MQVQFFDKNLAKSTLEELCRSRAVSVNILRGRISQEGASFELEVTGPAQKVKEFIRLSDTWGACVGTSSAGVA
jgi:hypothetical protein